MAGEMISFEMHGLKQLDEALGLLPEAVGAAILKSATLRGAKVIQQAAIAKAPVRTDGRAKKVSKKSQRRRKPGYLRKRILIKQDKESPYTIAYKIGPSKGAHYAMQKEFGSKHQAPQPFIRPAFDENWQKALGTSFIVLGRSIDTKAKQLSKKINFRFLTKGK